MKKMKKDKLRFLVIGDLHLNEWPEFATLIEVGNTYWNSRLVEQVQVLEQIYLYAKKYKPNVVVLLGDVFHRFTSLTSFVFKSFIDLLKTIKSVDVIYVIVGNHDYEDESRNIHYLSGFNDYKVEIVDRPLYSFIAGGSVAYAFFVPYIRNIDNVEFYFKELEEKNSNKDLRHKALIGFGHIDIENYRFGSGVYSKGLSLNYFSNFDLFINGHYHNPNSSDYGNVLFAGAVMDFNFSDIGSNQKGIWFLDIDLNGNIRKKFLPLKYKKFIEVKSLEGIDTDKYYIRLLVDEIKKDMQNMKNIRFEFKGKKTKLAKLDYRKQILNYVNAYNGNKKKCKKYILSVIKEKVLK